MISVLLPGSVVAVFCCIIAPKVYIFQDSTATFPGPVPSGYSTLQARHGHTQAYYSHQQAGLASHKIPPPSGFSGPAQGSQGGARYRNMAHLGTLPRPPAPGVLQEFPGEGVSHAGSLGLSRGRGSGE